MGSKKPKNPCIDICKIDRDTGLCRGCLRTRAEIRGWKAMSREERTQVLEAIELRREPAATAAATGAAVATAGREAKRAKENGAAPTATAAPAIAPTPTGAAAVASDGSRRWRHRGTGGLYEELHRALMERDQTPVVVYRGEDGRVWVRPAAQFDDGRFDPA